MKAESVQALLLKAKRALCDADIELSALDARLLLQAASGLTHEEIIAEPDLVLSSAQIAQFDGFITRRLTHEPVSRILGSREFYGRSFHVTPAVLDPRADTETIVEQILALPLQRHVRVLDIGTGSGAIIITLLAERTGWSGIALDVSAAALEVASLNAKTLGVAGRISFHGGAWFGTLDERFDLIVSNPPYIPKADIAGLEEDVRHFDPMLALDGGDDGLAAYRAIAAGAAAHLTPSGWIVLEIGAGQATEVTDIFADQGLKLVGQRADLGGHVRALVFQSV
ncbi:MAG: peptide chain release factor N(5)-glutamine methyltransferase [Alphaproteobacteria bacterium]|nr:peptide chain release factor N(5)-glutamine methyltransferase [Alphaproteobacteria bacterium]